MLELFFILENVKDINEKDFSVKSLSQSVFITLLF